MPDRIPSFFDDLRSALPYLTTVLLSCWGGLVNHVQKLRGGKRFRWRELLFDLLISSFAGILTHLACEGAGLAGAKAAVLVGISGHMGTRAIAGLASLYGRLIGPAAPTE